MLCNPSRSLLRRAIASSNARLGTPTQKDLPAWLPATFSTKATAANESSATASTTITTDTNNGSTNAKCPFSTISASWDGIDSDSTRPVPTLKDVPAVPVLGIFVEAIPFIGEWLSKTFYKNPSFTPHNAYDMHQELYQKYGNFYTTYIPGIGEGVWPKVFMLMDPEEMKKVIRQEGAYPRGGVEGLKPLIEWMKKNDFKVAGAGSEADNGFLGSRSWRDLEKVQELSTN